MGRVDDQRDRSAGATAAARCPVATVAPAATSSTRATVTAAAAIASRTAGATASAGATLRDELERARGVEQDAITDVAFERDEHDVAMKRSADQHRARDHVRSCRAILPRRTTTATGALTAAATGP